MEEKEGFIEALFDKFETYLHTSIELYKLKALDKLAEISSALVSSLAVLSGFMFFFLLFNIGLSLWIGEMLGKTYYGFFLVSGFYLLAGLIVYSNREKWIKEPVSDAVIDKLLK